MKLPRILATSFAAAVCFPLFAQSLKPLASQNANGYLVEAWTVEPADKAKASTQIRQSNFSSSNLFSDDFISRTNSTPPGFGNPSQRNSISSNKLDKTVVVGLQVRPEIPFNSPVIMEAAVGHHSIDDTGAEESPFAMENARHTYQWDKTFLAPLPVQVSSSATEIKKLEGTLYWQPVHRATFELSQSSLSSTKPIQQGSIAIVINANQLASPDPAIVFSVFSPEPKTENTRAKSPQDLMAQAQRLSDSMFEVTCTLIDANGNEIRATRNSSLGMQHSLDANSFRSLERELTLKARGKRGAINEKSASEKQSRSVNVKYELKVNAYRAGFKLATPATNVRSIRLELEKPLSPMVPIKFTLENIPLNASRSTQDLKRTCFIPPQNSPEESMNSEIDTTVSRTEVTVNDNGAVTKARATVRGDGTSESSVQQSPKNSTAASAGARGSGSALPQNGSASSTVSDPGGLFSAPAASPEQYRVWTDTTGQFQIEAVLVKADDKSVELRKRDGKTVQVPLSKLCEADRKFLKK